MTRNIGLARALSKLGYCSRSQAATLIRAGRVRLNGTVRRDPEAPVRMESDRIEVDGAPVRASEFVYLMLNKPRGVVTTAADEKGRGTVYALLPRDTPFVGPVGRLDKASEGLLLLTNDSEWAARITDPESHLPKTYHAQVRSASAEGLVLLLRQGIRSQGKLLRVREARVVRTGRTNAWLEIVLDEGRNRHIRRMLEELGVEVVRLIRIAIGSLLLGALPKGHTRNITANEKAALDEELRRLSNR